MFRHGVLLDFLKWLYMISGRCINILDKSNKGGLCFPMKKILLTGGGTAGHVTPNIALLPHLKEAMRFLMLVLTPVWKKI